MAKKKSDSKPAKAPKGAKPAKIAKTPVAAQAEGAPGINIGMSSGDRRKTSDGLAHFLSDAFTLYLKTHNFHWNVTGPMFNTLHTMFEGQYTEQWTALDEIAERIRALGFAAPASYADFARLSSIQDGPAVDGGDWRAMVQQLVSGNEAVRRRPYSLILLDEVEKAHPDVFNILLQVLDDGRLTDGQGRTVDFRNTVIVMTSNLGSHQIQDMFDNSGDGGDSAEAYTQMKAAVMGVVQAHFRPEFINRLDDIVVFHPLDKAQIKQIARIQLRGLEKRLAERGLRLEVSDKALELLANVGFDPVYGARPLKRAIQQQLENPLAQQILSGAFASGDTIVVDAEGGHVVFRKA